MLTYLVAPNDPGVAELDPLAVDDLLGAVRQMNASADANGLIASLRGLVPSESVIASWSLRECAAAMRDLGLFLGSLKRSGLEPLQVLPELRGALVALGVRTEMVPRDTVLHYTSWNPVGARERMYTGDAMERMLMGSVRLTLPRLTAALEQCRRLERLEPEQHEFAVVANELVAWTRALEDAIDLTKANVTPLYFARTLRPYFEAIEIDGVRYLGPAAAHIPLYLLDLAIWASDCSSLAYAELWRESARYGLAPWRELATRWSTSPSVVTRLSASLAAVGNDRVPPTLWASTDAVHRVLRAILVFRGKHIALARQAYDEDIRLYPLGSGGGSVELLAQLTALTRQNAELLQLSLAAGRCPARTCSPAP